MSLARLEAIYAELPEVPCTGQCYTSCSFIGTYAIERDNMRAAGITPPRVEQEPCPHLDWAGRCSIHERRPLICRLYGVTEAMRCPYGCKPERLLSREEGFEFLARVQAIKTDKDDEAESMKARLLGVLAPFVGLGER